MRERGPGKLPKDGLRSLTLALTRTNTCSAKLSLYPCTDFTFLKLLVLDVTFLQLLVLDVTFLQLLVLDVTFLKSLVLDVTFLKLWF